MHSRALRHTVLATVALLLAAQPLLAKGKKEEIDAFLKKAQAVRQFNGSALVADRDGVVLQGGYGMANFEWQIPNAADTKFRLGSITKQFTSMLILQLVAEGKLQLDGRLTAYLPDYRADTGNRVTITHLLAHTSGIPSYTGQPGFRPNVSRNPFGVAEFVKKHTSGDLEFEPGSKYAYNNSGYFLLGAIIEKVTGKPYEQVLRERVFEPLGMKDSGYDNSATVLPKRAAGYEPIPGGHRNAPYLDMSIPYAAGSLYSTVSDLYLWDRALYTDRLLPAELKKQMWTPVLESYAFGWAVGKTKLPNGAELATIRHNGGINGFSTVLVRVPETRELVVLLDNTSRDRMEELVTGILGILRGLPAPEPKRSIVDVLLASTEPGGVGRAIARYRERKTNEYDLNEGEINNTGYMLLSQGKVADAVELLKLNTETFPKSANTWDSLAEAYATRGDRDLAIANYRKSLELDPKNKHAEEQIKRLEAPEVKLTNPERFVGRYELAPGFVLAVTLEGSALFAQATGQPKLGLTARAPDELEVVGVEARLVFTLGESGPATAVVLHQGGRQMPGRRLE